MDIPVLVEQLPNKRFRARCGEPFALSAEGSTHAEAMIKLDSLVQRKLNNGSHLDVLKLTNGSRPRKRQGAGILKGHPLVNEWIETMASHRRHEDAES